MARTLLQLRDEAKQRCNQENKTLVSDSEWNRYINEAIGELYDLVVSHFPHYYVSSFPFTLSSSNQQSINALSPLFYKIRGVDYVWATAERPQTVRALNFQERNQYAARNFAGNYTLWYTPVPPTLTADGDTLDIILDVWAQYVTVTAAIAGATKEESDTDDLYKDKKVQYDRVLAAAPNRDGEPGQAADLMFGGDGTNDSGRRYMLEGNNLVIVGASLDVWP